MTETRRPLKSSATQFAREERKKLCNAWVKTNLSKSEFIRQNNLPDSFYAWCKKLLINKPLTTAKSSTSDGDAWVQILPKNTTTNNIDQPSAALELVELKLTCNNLGVKFSIPSDQVITFIKELSNATTVIR